MTARLETGFADAARDSQRVFRAIMTAMARPGTVVALDAGLAPPDPLAPGTAALALALCDFETPVWLDPALANPEAVAWLRFHTGAPVVEAPGKAAFAFAASPLGLPDLEAFALGSPEYPDRSTTVIVQLRSLDAGAGWRLDRPGIESAATLAPAPLPRDFVARRAALRPLFPRGLDFVFVVERQAAALPRTTVIEA